MSSVTAQTVATNPTANTLKNPSSTIKEIGNPHAFGDVTVDNSSVTTAELNDTGSELTKATEINGVVDPTFEFLNLKGPKPATFEKVAYFFIKRYYYTLSKVPHKSYLFYHSKALLIHGDEAQDVLPVKGLKNIHEHLIKLDFSKCNIVLTNVDCTPSVNGSIFIVVIGEVAYFSGLQKKFIQSFLLKEKSNGFTIVNDIFRYIVDTADEYPSGDYVKLKVKEDTIKLDVEPTGSVPTSPTSESTVSPSASDEAPIAEDLPPVENLPPSVEEILPSAEEKSSGAPKTDEVTPETTQSGSITDLTLEPTTTLTKAAKKKRAKALKKKAVEAEQETGVAEVEVNTNNKAEVETKIDEVKSETNTKVEEVKTEEKPKTNGNPATNPCLPSTPAPTKIQEKPKAWAKLPPIESAPVVSATTKQPIKPIAPAVEKPIVSTPVAHDENNDIFKSHVCLRFVRENTPKPVVIKALSKFGTVQNVEFNQRITFAEFTTVESASKAITAGQVDINGNRVQIEQRRHRQNHHGFYNRKNGNYNRYSKYGNNTSPTGSNESGDWSTPRPVGRYSGNRGVNH